MDFIFNTNDTILFQGDSITDCKRMRLIRSDLGSGYVNLINYYIQTHMQEQNITCYNKGIYGNRTTELKWRWKRDCLSLSPNVLSLLIGINDTWRRYDRNMITSPEKFRKNYLYLLDSTLQKFPYIKLVLMSPFLLPVQEEQFAWFEDLNPKIAIVHEIALEYGAIYIPLQDIFDKALSPMHPCDYWSKDGVHPTPSGHALIASSWLKYTKGVTL